MIPIQELLLNPRQEQIFTHRAPDDTFIHLLVDRLKASSEYLALEIVRTPVIKADALRIAKNNGVEVDHLKRITLDKFLEPITFINWTAENQQSLVDGNHRYVKAASLNLPFIMARLVPEPLWRRFTISGVPKEIAALLVDPAAKSGFDGHVHS